MSDVLTLDNLLGLQKAVSPERMKQIPVNQATFDLLKDYPILQKMVVVSDYIEDTNLEALLEMEII